MKIDEVEVGEEYALYPSGVGHYVRADKIEKRPTGWSSRQIRMVLCSFVEGDREPAWHEARDLAPWADVKAKREAEQAENRARHNLERRGWDALRAVDLPIESVTAVRYGFDAQMHLSIRVHADHIDDFVARLEELAR